MIRQDNAVVQRLRDRKRKETRTRLVRVVRVRRKGPHKSTQAKWWEIAKESA